ncbi:MAG: M23 family metallopeptidase [Prevotellaceae bacterium]|jgi:murein DD-endopeptidase MepM/ murein hydrolase activator NlpD|nr:M23 family metallopeptidase [Prevotellaceae bacterium]
MAQKTKFHFNPETLSYERITRTFSSMLKKVLLHLFSGFTLGIAFFFAFNALLDSPKEKRIKAQINQQNAQYEILDRQLNQLQDLINDFKERDNNFYRVIFQADPISEKSLKLNGSNSHFYQQILKSSNSKIMAAVIQKMDTVRAQMYIQSKSYDELLKLAKNYEARLEQIPAIQPVLNKDLSRIASGYGWRIDPIYHTSAFHAGMDFTAPIGTDVYATGNGRVILANWNSGYGSCVEIDHGYGYVTLYGHLSKVLVREGQTVKRGDIIGLVGSTGKSTGPHLHYEVHLNNAVMNPANFYYKDLSPEEYDRMMQLSNNAGRALD